ncbi:MAG: lipoyl(octanoyl) transferase LipB [Planctomycetota bacterium]
MKPLTVFKLGPTAYDEALSFQFELVERVRESRGKHSFLVLLEHQPVITLGKNANGNNILASPEALKKRGIEVKQIDRGGDVTYHGPGQLVGYPIIQLAYHKKTLREYVRLLEQTLIQTLAGFGIDAYTKDTGSAGVWVSPVRNRSSPMDDRTGGAQYINSTKHQNKNVLSDVKSGISNGVDDAKIGFIGMRVSKGVTYHGFSFNVNNELDAFGLINPCGMKNPKITSLSGLLKRQVPITEVTARYLESFGNLFNVGITEVKTHLSYMPQEMLS